MICTVGIRAPTNRRDELFNGFVSLLGPTKVEPGCIDCHLYQDLENENGLKLEVIWKTRAALEKYVRSESFSRILALMEVSTHPPSMRFETIGKSEGIELVESIRGQRANGSDRRQRRR